MLIKCSTSIALLLLAVVAVSQAEVVHFKTCDDADVASCTINEVRVEPCPQAAQNAACHIKRRKPATMSYDFTPHFDADTLEADLTWVKSADQELPLATMDKVGCGSTPCPVKSGVRQTYTLEVPIESKFPTSAYTIRWSLKEPQGKRCCFTIDIKVVR